MNQISTFVLAILFFAVFLPTSVGNTLTSDLEIEYTVINTSCAQASDGSILISDIKGGLEPYEVYLNDDFVGTNSFEFPNLYFGSYKVTIIDAQGLTVNNFVDVDYENDFDFDITEQVTIRKGDSYTIDLQIFEEYDSIRWFLAPKIDDFYALQPVVNPEKDQIYKAEISYKKVCKIQTEVFVEVDTKRYVYFPTIFSPNNDGVNDTFSPSISNQVIEIKRFVISDRWGRIVHSRRGKFTNPNEILWDGKVNSEFCESGQYIYLCEIEFDDGQVIKYKGSVSIL
jgi:gliding motility-associated-like protein